MIAALFAALIVIVLLAGTFVTYAAFAIAEHAGKHPQAYKALYQHVFLPVVAGPEKSAAVAALETQEPVDLSAVE